MHIKDANNPKISYVVTFGHKAGSIILSRYEKSPGLVIQEFVTIMNSVATEFINKQRYCQTTAECEAITRYFFKKIKQRKRR